MQRLSFIFIILLLWALSYSQSYAQTYTLSISPTSGTTGTTVSLSTSPSYSGESCFANGNSIGRSYTIPAGVSGSITFYCEAGSGEFYTRTNDAVFTIQAQQNPDNDGDGIPNNQDNCPNRSAPNSQNGCSPPQDNTSTSGSSLQTPQPQAHVPQPTSQLPDSDGDGIPDNQDTCPNSQGEQDLNGCALPAIPAEGDCLVATNGVFNVNVRETFSLSSEVTQQLNPLELYTVRAKATIPEQDSETGEFLETELANRQVWYLLDIGWVASWVTRTGGNCNVIPEVYQTTEGEISDDPPIVCGDPLVVVFEDFNEADVSDLIPYITRNLSRVDIEVTDHIYIGTDCDEIIFASPYSDIILSKGGNDIIYTFDGDDVINGGDGNDQIYAGNGIDFLFGGSGDDRLHGSNGEFNKLDTIPYSDRENDYIYGGDGNDTITAGWGRDTLYGEDGNDTLYGGRGNDRIFGGNGNDRLNGFDGTDLLIGADGDDRLAACPGGLDVLLGNQGNDYILYEEENIACSTGSTDSNVVIEGNEGNDTITVINPFTQLPNLIHAHGNEGNDILYGSPGAVLYGDDGDDYFSLEFGVAFGGAGDDQFFIGVSAIVFAEDGNDFVEGGSGADYIFGGSGNDFVQARQGRDYIYGGDGNDELYGLQGITSRWYEIIDGANYIDGGSGSDIMVGGPYHDFCRTGLFDGDSTTSCHDEDNNALRIRENAIEYLSERGYEGVVP